jgi:hypothetical protein
MATATGKGGLRPMSVAKLRQLMERPAVSHHRGGRARAWLAVRLMEHEAEAAAHQGDWSDPAYGTDGAAS